MFSCRTAGPREREIQALPRPCVHLHLPSDDAAPSPHEGNATIIEGPAKLSGCLSEQHKALRVGDDLGRIEGLESNTRLVSAVATPTSQVHSHLRGDPREERLEMRTWWRISITPTSFPWSTKAKARGCPPFECPPGMTPYCQPAGPSGGP